jgi:predicted outer membrane repeat protein
MQFPRCLQLIHMSRASIRNRRRAAQNRRSRFTPWTDRLEDRVVLTTFYQAPDFTALANAITQANSLNDTDAVIYLTGSSYSGAYAPPTFNPTTSPGLNLSILNPTTSTVSINLPSAQRFLAVGPLAGAVTINGGAKGISLSGGSAAVTGNGGAIDFEGNTPSLTNLPYALEVVNVTFTNNQVTGDGGAIYVGTASGSTPPGAVIVDHCMFGSSSPPGNTAGDNGGAIDDENSASLRITSSTFEGNTAAFSGGAVLAGSGCGPVTVINSTFGGTSLSSHDHEGNSAIFYGGALCYEGSLQNNSSLNLDGVLFAENRADAGGAIAVVGDGSVYVSNSEFGTSYTSTRLGSLTDGNIAGEFGGAIYDIGTTSEIMISRTSFTGNSSTRRDGGAIYAVSTAPVIMNGTTFSHNSTGGGFGGALAFANSSSLTISNSSFTSNTVTNTNNGAGAFGGAICAFGPDAGSGSVDIDSTTFASNSAAGIAGAAATASAPAGAGSDAEGGAIDNYGYTFTITNSSFTSNSAKGAGGAGGFGQSGGAGGNAVGGAIRHRSSLPLNMPYGVSFKSNSVTGGAGGKAGGGTSSGGAGGDAYGGAVELDSGVGTMVATFTSNTALGGAGGAGGTTNTGGTGGAGYGGAVRNLSTSGSTISLSTFSKNKATGGAGGTSGNKQLLGIAGRGWGGGVFNLGIMTLTSDLFDQNAAVGGTGRCITGNDGSGVGGGVFNGGTNAVLTANNDRFTSNTAQGRGGAGGSPVGGGAGGGLSS